MQTHVTQVRVSKRGKPRPCVRWEWDREANVKREKKKKEKKRKGVSLRDKNQMKFELARGGTRRTDHRKLNFTKLGGGREKKGSVKKRR